MVQQTEIEMKIVLTLDDNLIESLCKKNEWDLDTVKEKIRNYYIEEMDNDVFEGTLINDIMPNDIFGIKHYW